MVSECSIYVEIHELTISISPQAKVANQDKINGEESPRQERAPGKDQMNDLNF